MQLNNYNLELEIKKFQHCWEQGQIAFHEGQRSAKKIADLLKVSYGSSFSTKYIIKKMMILLGHLNGISDYKLKRYLEVICIEEKEVIRIITDLEAITTYSNNKQVNYLNDSIREELKSIQRSIVLLRQDLPKIIHYELIRSKITKKRQGF